MKAYYHASLSPKDPPSPAAPGRHNYLYSRRKTDETLVVVHRRVRGTRPDLDARRPGPWGFAIAPLPLTFKPWDRKLVGLGSYIVNSQGLCTDCHTVPQFARGGNPFLGEPKQINLAGYLKGGKRFPIREGTPVEGFVFSRNLRTEGGLPAGLTLEQFVDVMRNGTDFDHQGRLLQVMQWPIFQDMTDRDLVAIYAYLAALPAP